LRGERIDRREIRSTKQSVVEIHGLLRRIFLPSVEKSSSQ
jgi:hypothetical protein